MMIVQAFILLHFLEVVVGNAGQCYSWRYNDVFFIKRTSLAESAVVDRVDSRSFVECCVKCDAVRGCHGVAFKDGECSHIDGTAAQSFVVSDGSGDDYKVKMHNTAADGQIEHNCIGDCQKCIPSDCKGLLSNGHTTDGEYTLDDGTQLYCDMTGGGWTVIQRRVDDTVNFTRGWVDYVAGFGNLSGNFWAGLENIHNLTSGSATELYVSMAPFEGESAWAHYSSFRVGDAASGYVMSVSGYNGTALNAMSYHDNMKFSTVDNDQDLSSKNCSEYYHGAWWHNDCFHTNPNGLYLASAGSAHSDGVVWSYSTFLKTIEFKIRRL